MRLVVVSSGLPLVIFRFAGRGDIPRFQAPETAVERRFGRIDDEPTRRAHVPIRFASPSPSGHRRTAGPLAGPAARAS
jgi:hypothetical protein